MRSGGSAFFSKLAQRLITVAFLTLLSGVSQAGSVVYAYDSLGRLTSVTYSNGVVITYNYDAAGNRSNYTVSGAP